MRAFKDGVHIHISGRAVLALAIMAGASVPILLAAGTVGPLIQFANGTTAEADDVNANFAALRAEINDNAATITATNQAVAANADDIVDLTATANNPLSGIVNAGTGRRWADGTHAPGCWAYRAPTDGLHAYSGVTGDGRYTVDPDGAGGAAPFEVYCNMTLDAGGWTLVDNDATASATFGDRQAGANTDPTVTRGSYLPDYTWSPSPQLLCQSDQFDGDEGWVSFNVTAAGLDYPTVTEQTGPHGNTFTIDALNGNSNRGFGSWIYNGSGRFGSVWIGGGSAATCACNYTGASSGLGTTAASNTTTCSTWVR